MCCRGQAVGPGADDDGLVIAHLGPIVIGIRVLAGRSRPNPSDTMRLDTTDQYLFRHERVVEDHDVGGTAGCERATVVAGQARRCGGGGPDCFHQPAPQVDQVPEGEVHGRLAVPLAPVRAVPSVIATRRRPAQRMRTRAASGERWTPSKTPVR
jgi:hypothetical protein